MFEQTTQKQGRDGTTQRRLADITDIATDTDSAEGTGGTDAAEISPEARDPVGGRVGRWAERWLPPRVADVLGDMPVRMRPRNSGPRRRRVALSVVAGIAVALGAVVVVLVGRPSSEAPPPLPVAHEQPASPAATPEPDPDAGTEDAAVDPGPEGDSEPDELVVSVVGKVREPGLVTLPAGARVAEAVEAAGGPRPGADLLSVNLARKLVDGEQLYVDVPVPPGMEPQPGDGAEDGSAVDGADGDGDGGLVSLNSADQDELETLSGVGEVTAQRIIEWRTEHGGFTAIEELREVDGIGDKKFESLREHVSVS